jgi:hypothetical protein
LKKLLSLFFFWKTWGKNRPLEIKTAEGVEIEETARASDLESTINFIIHQLRKIDEAMTNAGLTRQERREFWREAAKSSENREHLISSLANRIRKE